MINELFKEEGQSIYTFKPGDIIIRMKSAPRKDTRTNENLGIDVEVTLYSDNSFRDVPVEFIAIKNNLIYLRSMRKSYLSEKKDVYKVLLEQYEENWKLFEIPEGLTMEDCI